MLFSYSNVLAVPPLLSLSGSAIDHVKSFKYLGVTLESCPSNWKEHCDRILKKARGIIFSFRLFYSQLTSRTVILHVFRSIVRPVLEYGAELVLPNSHFAYQFERLQRFAVSSHLNRYSYGDGEYHSALEMLNFAPMGSRRAALGVCYLLKILFGTVDVSLVCLCFGSQLQHRRSARLDTINDLVILQSSVSADGTPRVLRPRCERFKCSYLYRAVRNYNTLRKVADIDQFPFKRLRKFLELFNVDDSGLFLV